MPFLPQINRLMICLVFTLPVILGDAGTALIIVFSFWYLPAMSAGREERTPSARVLSRAFGLSFLLVAIAFAITAENLVEFRLVLNFSPLLLSLLVLRQQPGLAVSDPMTLIAWHALAGAFIAGVIGMIGHHMLGIARVGMHVVNPIHFGNIAIFLGFLSVIGLFSAKKNGWIFLSGPICGFIAAIYSGSRGPMLTGIVLCILLFGFVIARFGRDRRTLTIGSLMVLVIGFGLATLVDALDIGRINGMLAQLAEFLSTGTFADRSSTLRFEMYVGGIMAFLDSPLFGHGWENLVSAIEPYLTPDVWARISGFKHLHNDIIDFAVGAGILGVFAYMITIAAPVIAASAGSRSRDFVARLYGASVLSMGFVISGLTNLLLGNGLQTTLFCFMAVLVIGLEGGKSANDGGNDLMNGSNIHRIPKAQSDCRIRD